MYKPYRQTKINKWGFISNDNFIIKNNSINVRKCHVSEYSQPLQHTNGTEKVGCSTWYVGNLKKNKDTKKSLNKTTK